MASSKTRLLRLDYRGSKLRYHYKKQASALAFTLWLVWQSYLIQGDLRPVYMTMGNRSIKEHCYKNKFFNQKGLG